MSDYEKTTAKYAAMTLADAEAELMNAVYAATAIMERMEHAGKIRGNGHHARQAVAAKAVEELRGRWIPSKCPTCDGTGIGASPDAAAYVEIPNGCPRCGGTGVRS